MSEEEKFVLLTESYEFGEFDVRGVFDTHEDAMEYVNETLNSSIKYDIRGATHY